MKKLLVILAFILSLTCSCASESTDGVTEVPSPVEELYYESDANTVYLDWIYTDETVKAFEITVTLYYMQHFPYSSPYPSDLCLPLSNNSDRFFTDKKHLDFNYINLTLYQLAVCAVNISIIPFNNEGYADYDYSTTFYVYPEGN